MNQVHLSFGEKPFTVLSFGGGQDSTAILLKCMYDDTFRETYAPGEILVVMADTGDEHAETYEHVARMQRLCQSFPYIHFVLITPDMGFHPKTWPSLRYQMEKNNTIMSKGFSKSCTDNLKIKPIYNFVEDYIGKRYGFRKKNKANYYGYQKLFGKLHILLGIAAGEDSRIGGQMPSPWMNECLHRVYPLHELGYDRAACQQIIASYGEQVPPPSNCILCPWMSKQELLYMHTFMRADFDYYVLREKAKMAKPVPEGKNNLGVFGKKTLEQVLADAQKEYGHWTVAELREYKFSHGHCSKNKY
jgi:hypothetical protein